MHPKVYFYSVSYLLNFLCCITVYRAKGFPTVNVFLLHILLPSAVNSLLLLAFSVLQEYTTITVFENLYDFVDIYVAYQYPVIGSFFHVLTSLLYTKPVTAAEIISKQTKYFFTAQTIAVVFTFTGFAAEIGSSVLVTTFWKQRALLSTLYEIPCFLCIHALFLTYILSIWQIVTYRRKSSNSVKCRKTRTVVIFFTPIIIFYVANIVDFGITLICDAMLLSGGLADEDHKEVRDWFKPFYSYYYPAQMVIYPICTVIAFPEYRGNLGWKHLTSCFKRKIDHAFPNFFPENRISAFTVE